MAGGTAIHIVTRADLRTGRTLPWSDPNNYAALTPRKQQLLLANPFAGGEDEPVQLVGVRDGQAIGRFDVMPTEVIVGGEPVRVHFGSTLFVPREHRRSLLGVTLVLKLQSLFPIVAASAASQDALPVYEKLKWFDVPMQRYVLIRRSRSVLEKYLRSRAAAKGLSPFADALLALPRIAGRAIGAPGLRGLDIERADRMPQDLDVHLAQCDQPIATHRSAAWINWMLTHTFGDDERLQKRLLLVRDRSGEPLGYLIVRVRFYELATHRGFPDLLLGSLKDWMIFDRSRLNVSQIVHLAVSELSRMGADAIEVCLRPEETPRWLRAAGFVAAGVMHMHFKGKPKTPLADPQNQRPEDWRIRPADGDSFFG